MSNHRLLPAINAFKNAEPASAEKLYNAAEVVRAFRMGLLTDIDTEWDDEEGREEFILALADLERAAIQLNRAGRKVTK